MTNISFKHLEIAGRQISLRAEYEHNFDLHFKFDRSVAVTSTQVALAMATLAGKKFRSIEFDFEVDENVKNVIESATDAHVTAVSSEQRPPITSDAGNVLSFSGGFDSLSALRLMPRDTQMVSLDFGGWFAREAEFFKKFEPLTITTNARSEPTQGTSLARNHWTFMAIGAILSAGYFNAKYHSFGQILGESLSRVPSRVSTPVVLSSLGYEDAGYARGLTEVGTAAVILQSDPSIVNDSLKSLSGATDRKLFRKTEIVKILSDRLNIRSGTGSPDYSRSPRIRFGEDYASTLAGIYCLSRDIQNPISRLFDDVPKSAYKLAESCSMDFMEKVNWDAYISFPDALREGLWANLFKFGFEPYSEKDWEEVEEVRTFLASAHELALEMH